MSPRFRVTVLNADEGRVSVVIPEDAAPLFLGNDGEEYRDFGNADWPTDEEIAAEAARMLGRRVMSVRFVDVGDTLAEGIYAVKP